MQYDHVPEKMNIDPLRGGGGGGGLRAKYLLPCCCIGDSLGMQHGHVLKNLYFNLLTPKAREWGGVCGGNICYHVAAFVIPFNLICNMKMF